MDNIKQIISLLQEAMKIASQFEKSNQGCQLCSDILTAYIKTNDLLVLMESCN